ncbi:MAG: phosphopantetheine-binding protein [Pseudomonadota bacterium]
MALEINEILLANVTEVYRMVFPDEPIDIESDFFDLGGDSLSIVTFCALLEERLGREVHPSLLIYHPTVETLTLELTAQSSAET